MAPVLNLVYAGLDFTKAPSFSAGLKQFAYDRSLLAQIWEGTVMFVKESWTWLDTHIPSRVLVLFGIWFLVYMLVWVIVVAVTWGFGPGGVIGGTIAASFQSWAYGAFTPALSIFAMLTSLGATGALAPVQAGTAAVAASIVTALSWWYGVGKS